MRVQVRFGSELIVGGRNEHGGRAVLYAAGIQKPTYTPVTWLYIHTALYRCFNLCDSCTAFIDHLHARLVWQSLFLVSPAPPNLGAYESTLPFAWEGFTFTTSNDNDFAGCSQR
jgi:hypothetical protein